MALKVSATFLARTADGAAQVGLFKADVIDEIGRRERAQRESSVGLPLAKARFHEGQAAALQALREWLQEVEIVAE